MNNYRAWIKELSSIVYDNSKSEYQIISEIIPLLLQIKDSQNSNSELMDAIYNEIASKISELKEQMTNFTSEFNSKLEEYKTNLDSSNSSFLSSLQEKFNSFITSSTALINNYNETFTNKKNEIDTLIASTNNLNSNLIQQYDAIISKINNYIPNIINSSDTSNFIYNTIINKFNADFSNRESNYINLTSITTQPASANENDIYYNSSENKLYQYTNSSWTEIDYIFDKIYKFNNHLLTPQLVITEIGKPSITLQSVCIVDETHYLGWTGNVGTKVYFTLVDSTTFKFGSQINIETPPEGYSSFEQIIYWNGQYYMKYSNTKIATSTDLANWTYLMDLPQQTLTFAIINNQLFAYSTNFSYMLTRENELIKSWYNMLGYYNGYYYFIASVQKGSKYVSRIYKNANFSATNEGYEEVYTANKILNSGYTDLISANNNYFQSFKSIILNNDEYIENANSINRIIATENILFSYNTIISYKNNIINKDIDVNLDYAPYLNFNNHILSTSGVVYDVTMQLKEIR